MGSFREQRGSWRATGAHRPRRNWRASGCWVQGQLKRQEWNEGYAAPFLSDKKHFQVSKLHYTALVQLCKFQTSRTNNIVATWGNAAGLWRSSQTSLVAACCHLVTYLHSPFLFVVASHLPPFRHDSVGREHFRPVEQNKDLVFI